MTKPNRFEEALDSVGDRLHPISLKKRKDGTNALFIGDTEVAKSDLARYKQEINILERTTVWKLINDTLKASGQEICVKTSTNFDQVIVGKTLVYSADIIKKATEDIEKADITN